ncbi:MAG: CHRD domain-containing protein [Pirellulales bacterium]
MRCLTCLFAVVFLVLFSAAPAYSIQLLYQTVRVNPTTGAVLGPGMDGPSEPTNSPGTGYGTALYDNVARTLTLDCDFSGLGTDVGTGTSASHIHAATTLPFQGTAGVATTTPSFVGFPLNVFAGTFHSVLDLTQASSWNPSYVTNNGGTTATAEATFAAAMASGRAYWNIHSQRNGGGEIRGFFQLVPEPATAAMALLAVLGLAGGFARRR